MTRRMAVLFPKSDVEIIGDAEKADEHEMAE
jgi:hypothetical protein